MWETVRSIQAEQGWDDATMLMHALDFIAESELLAELADYLRVPLMKEDTS